MDGLNTVHGLPREEEQYLEDVFYQAADDDVARALRHMFTSGSLPSGQGYWHARPVRP